MRARKLIQTGSKEGESIVMTVPIDFIREMGVHSWLSGGGDQYRVWVTWLEDREAFSYWFPDPNSQVQPNNAIPRSIRVKSLKGGNRAYQVTIPKGALHSRGITDKVLDEGYYIFPEASIEDRLLTIELPRPEDRPEPWAGLGEALPETPAPDWVTEGNNAFGTSEEVSGEASTVDVAPEPALSDD